MTTLTTPTSKHPTPSPVGAGDVLTPGHIDVGDDGLAGSRAWVATVVTFLATVVVAFGAIVSLNIYVDPWGIVGSGPGAFGLHHFDGVNRSQKVQLLGALEHAPDTIVLGSSTIRNIDPAMIRTLTEGDEAFNASVSAGKPLDNFAFAAYLYERFPKAKTHVVYGVDVEATFFETPPNPGIRTTPELWRQLPLRDRLRLYPQLHREYTALETARESLTIWRRTNRSGVFGATTIEPATLRMTPLGYRKADPYARAQLSRRLPRETARYRDTVYATDDPARLGRRSRDYLERIVRLANRHGDRPTLVLLPAQPDARRELTPYGWADRRDAILDYLRGLDGEHDVRVIDFSDPVAFGGAANADGFVDNAHMTVVNSNRMLTELHRRGAL